MSEDYSAFMSALPRTKLRNRLIGALVVLAVIAAAVVPQLRHRPSTLLMKSHKIASLGDWDPKHDNYFWLSGQDVLVVMQGSKSAYGDPNPVTVQRLDTQTGVLTEDLPLKNALHKANADGRVPNWQLSPDTLWLLGEANLHTNREQWVATRTDGTRQIIRPHQADEQEDNGLFALWRPDSRSWIQTTADNAGGYHDNNYSYQLDRSQITKQVESFSLEGHSLIGFFGANRVLAIRIQTGDGGGIGVADFGDVSSSVPAKFYLPQVPANMDVQEVVLSPDRTRLAWKFAVKPLPLGIKATINSSYVRHSAPSEAGLWISDLNFNHLHEIGTLDIRDDHVSNLRWTPDGQQLSFINADALYTVPIR